MGVSVFSAAKRLCVQSDWSLSNLEIQKLIYLAQMFHLGHYDGRPLVSGHFEAWEFGPVHPDLYHYLKIFGSSPVKKYFHPYEEASEGTEASMIDDVAKHLAHSRPGRLVAITHWEDGAWAKNYEPGVRGSMISNEDILEEYRERERNREAQAAV